MEVQVSPAMLAGINPPGGKVVSPEADDLISRLRDHYRQQGKASAAHNYSRHLKSFFSWAERVGYSIKSLPPDAVESFLATLSAAGQKVASVYVMRTQLKSALKAAHEIFGAPFGHLEYLTGKPTEVRKTQKDKEKRQRAEKRLVQTAQTLQAIQAAQKTIFGAGTVPTVPLAPVQAIPVPTHATDTEEIDMIDASAPQSGGNVATGSTPPPQTIVLNVPSAAGANAQRATIAGGNQQQNRPQGADRPGIRINSLTFNGAYVKVSYVADGASPLVAPGTPVQLQVYPTSQIAIHGDVSTFLQSFVIPTMRLAPTTAQVQFIFEELNEKRHPTGRRDEIVVAVPNGTMPVAAPVATAAAPAPVALAGMPYPATSGMDEATRFLLTRLDRDAEEQRKRAEALQEEMKKASDAQTTFLLMQQHRQAEDLRRELEEQKRRELDRIERSSRLDAAPPPMPLTPAMPFPTILPPEPVRDNSAAEFAKALAESQKNMMELMLASMNRPQPTPPPPPQQKDAAEWLMPFIAQMNQQAQAQQQANQQMLVGIMQANQQFMQALITRENPMEKLLFTQLQEVKAAANSPKADELESFADKLQKMKMVSDMLGGGGNTNLLSELLANADTIGAGAAKVIQAAKMGGPTPTPQQIAGNRQPTGQAQPPALPPAQGVTTPTIPPPPEEALTQLAAVTAGVEAADEQAIINGVVELVKALMGAPEPYPMQGRRILAAFQNADDEGELYTLAKNLWTILGQQYDRPAAKAVARALAKWYSVIHQQIFGEPKELLEAQDAESDEDGDEDEDDTEADDSVPSMVAGG